MPSTPLFSRALLVALLALIPLRVTTAQTLAPGTRVRISSSELITPIIGSYQGMRRDTLVLIEDGQGAKVWGFNSAAVKQVEVSAGMQGGNRGPMAKWGLIGAAIGGTIGLVTAVTLENSTDSRYNEAMSTLLGAVMGGGIGTFYGSRKLEEHWAAVPLPGRIGVAPARTGVRIGLSAAF